MALIIKETEKLAVTTTAKDININNRAFMIENLTDDETVHFKEKNGVAVSVDNGFAIKGAKLLDKVFRADTLSIKGSASCDVRIMYVMEE